MSSVNSHFLISTLIILIGFIIKKYKIISEKDGEALSKVILNVTMPAAVISSTSTLEFDLTFGLMPLVAILYGILMTISAIVLFRKETSDNRGMMSMLLPGLSVALFAFPFIEAIMGARGLTYVAMFDAGNGLSSLAMAYSLGLCYSGSNSRLDVKSIIKQIFKSVPLIVYLTTLVVSISGLHFPSIILNISQNVGKANTPLCLITLGVFLSFKMEGGNWRNIFRVLSARYLIGLTIGTILYFTLPVDAMIRQIILICLVVPPPMTALAFTVKFNYDKKFVGMLMNTANIISYFLMWGIFNIVTL
jgi:predicted permease